VIMTSSADPIRSRFTPNSTRVFVRRSISRRGTPERATAQWATFDREAVDRAVIIPFPNPKASDFVSKPVGNYRHHPVFGMLMDQVWVR
jgi:hypothetical protein